MHLRRSICSLKLKFSLQRLLVSIDATGERTVWPGHVDQAASTSCGRLIGRPRTPEGPEVQNINRRRRGNLLPGNSEMATLACRRTLVLTVNNSPAPPLLILSSSAPSPPSCHPSPSSRAAAAAAAALPYDERQGRISWRPLCPRSSAFSRSNHHSNWSHRQQRLFSVPPAPLRQSPTTAADHTAVPARQVLLSRD